MSDFVQSGGTAWKQIKSEISKPFYDTQPVQVPPPVGLSQLNEKFHSMEFASVPETSPSGICRLTRDVVI